MTSTSRNAAALAAMAVALAGGATHFKALDESGHGFAPVYGTRLFYEVRGTGSPVVLIHGGQLDCRMWDDQLTALAQHFRVIRYDVRGYGGSVQPDMLYSDADDLAGLLDYLKVNKAHIVGLSLGGRIAIDFAVAHPARRQLAYARWPWPGWLRASRRDGNRSPNVEHRQGSARRGAGAGHGPLAKGPIHGAGDGAGPAGAQSQEDWPRECPLLAAEPRAAAVPEAARCHAARRDQGSHASGDRRPRCAPDQGDDRRRWEKGSATQRRWRSRAPATWSIWRSLEIFNEAVLSFLRQQSP